MIKNLFITGFFLAAIISSYIYINKYDMPLSSYVISQLVFFFPILSPLDKGLNKNEILKTREFFEPSTISKSKEVNYIDIPMNPDDHRNQQEIYLQKVDRTLYRIYIPNNLIKPAKVIMWFHGGAFVIGSIRADNDICNKLSINTKSIVVSVNYGLAPENKFPVAIEDSISSVKWVFNNIKKYGGNNKNIYLVGESAGGNIVLSILPYISYLKIKGIISIYPPLQIFTYSNSHWRYATKNGFLMLNHLIKAYDAYLDDIIDSQDERANPLLISNKNIKLFPKTMVILAKYDILYDDGILFSKKLKKNNVPVDLIIYPDIHGFFNRFGYGENAFKDVISFIQS